MDRIMQAEVKTAVVMAFMVELVRLLRDKGTLTAPEARLIFTIATANAPNDVREAADPLVELALSGLGASPTVVS